MEQEERIEQQQAAIHQQQVVIAELEPKAVFHDTVTDSDGCIPIQALAKVLGIKPKRLFDFLREDGILMKRNDNTASERPLPYQRFIDSGYFVVVERLYPDVHGKLQPYLRTYVTGKGQVFVQKRLALAGELPAQVALLTQE